MTTILRFDYVFSYWIFAWFILYILKIVSYSPKFLIILGIIANLFLLLFLIINHSTLYNIIKFIIINTFIKVIPLFFVWKDKIVIKDIKASIILFIIYIIWLYISGGVKNFYKIYRVFRKLQTRENPSDFPHPAAQLTGQALQGSTEQLINNYIKHDNYKYDGFFRKLPHPADQHLEQALVGSAEHQTILSHYYDKLFKYKLIF